IGGSTITKSVAFFIHACRDADIALGPHIKAPKPPKGSNGGRSRKRGNPPPGGGADSQDPPPPPREPVKSTAELLLNKFPDFDPSWPDDLKQKWFDSFGTLQGMMSSKDEKGGAS